MVPSIVCIVYNDVLYCPVVPSIACIMYICIVLSRGAVYSLYNVHMYTVQACSGCLKLSLVLQMNRSFQCLTPPPFLSTDLLLEFIIFFTAKHFQISCFKGSIKNRQEFANNLLTTEIYK